MRVIVRSPELHPVALSAGERLVFGRAPHRGTRRAGRYTVAVPGCGPHVSRVLGDVLVEPAGVRLTWRGANEAMLSSLFDAPGGARRVTLVDGMSVVLDEGKNELVVFAGLEAAGGPKDLALTFMVSGAERTRELTELSGSDLPVPEAAVPTAEAPEVLSRYSKVWYVALALTEPLLTGTDDEQSVPTHQEIHRRIDHWREGDAWNLADPRRVDEAIKKISRIAFGESLDPYGAARDGRLFNARFAVAKRAAQRRLVTAEDLDEVERAARRRSGGRQ
ncbi:MULTISPECIES: hypothetical protein [Prauserella salsuginis group]|uniref:Uncharacterized protein n=1 Tax=Prauserella salsuginis TaxID=387889 RepID=A0ABW6GAT8_9PSEU|nr:MULTISPECIES: hypothetical protein [Prauserella salsuginis group]MCR3720614.1 hypothetical protein [Prauserella flava]MCR3735305.1 hypothetical protein [Prauserella salsuginis]